MDKLDHQKVLLLSGEQLRHVKRIQEEIIPQAQNFKSSSYKFYSYLKPYNEIGGDFFDYKIFDHDCASIILADATGHGFDASFLTGIIKLSYYHAINDERVKASPSQLIKNLDRDLEFNVHSSCFSCFTVYLDPNRQILSWGNAGHPSAVLIHQNGTTVLLQANYPLIGMHTLASIFEYKDIIDRFSPGDKLVLFTDGLIDGINPEGERYSFKRLTQIINFFKTADIDSLCNAIIQDFDNFTSNEPTDDVCLLGLEFLNKAQN